MEKIKKFNNSFLLWMLAAQSFVKDIIYIYEKKNCLEVFKLLFLIFMNDRYNRLFKKNTFNTS